jgi:hypothetical protein
LSPDPHPRSTFITVLLPSVKKLNRLVWLTVYPVRDTVGELM